MEARSFDRAFLLLSVRSLVTLPERQEKTYPEIHVEQVV